MSRLDKPAMPRAVGRALWPETMAFSHVCALVVTYNPPSTLESTLKRTAAQVSRILVIDNGSHAPSLGTVLPKPPPKVTVLAGEENLGLAAALNRGFQWALDRGFRYVLTLDQDSRPEAGMVSALLRVYNCHPLSEKIAVVAPRVVDPELRIEARFLRPGGRVGFRWTPCRNQWLDDVSVVITSGSLYQLSVYRELGGFREDFFIDYVDTEYCLRARCAGYLVVASCKARLEHRLGNRQRRALLGWTVYPTFHPPQRWYYIARNRIPMLREYGLRVPHWLVYELVATVYTTLRMLLFEDRRLAKLRAIACGTLDGILGRMGGREGLLGLHGP